MEDRTETLVKMKNRNEELADAVETARIYAGALGEQHGRNKEWRDCEFYFSIRDMLRTIKESIEEHAKILESEKAPEPVRAYKCDPKKNTACKKTGCYERGGFCELTLNPEFAKEDESGDKP